MLPKFPCHKLLEWYKKNGRHDLPWRDYSSDEKILGYRVWLAETMLQQTQVERVKEYFTKIMQAFPTVEDLAKTSYEDFFPYYKGLGYYSRARNMLKAAQKVVADFGGVFPKSVEELRTLPGVGPYTAEAIRAFAYDIPTLSFDTNLEKIFSRYYFGNKFQKLTKEEKEELLVQMREYYESPLAPLDKGGSFTKGGKGISRDINNALMDYGATISLNTISGIDWENYPFPESKFYQTRGQLEPVVEKKTSSFPAKQAYIICILHENHRKYFSLPVSQNLPPAHTAIPLIKGEQKESPLSREMSEGQRDFSPFLIGKNSGNPRAMTQSYFRENFGLEVSVRPPEVKSYNKDEIPYMVCYAQIQSGKNSLSVFENLTVRGYEEGYVEEMEFGEKSLSLF